VLGDLQIEQQLHTTKYRRPQGTAVDHRGLQRTALMTWQIL